MSAQIIDFPGDFRDRLKPIPFENSLVSYNQQRISQKVDYNLKGIYKFGYEYFENFLDYSYRSSCINGDGAITFRLFWDKIIDELQKCTVFEYQRILISLDIILTNKNYENEKDREFYMYLRNFVFQKSEKLRGRR